MAKKITASVLAFEKKLVSSDAFFYGTTWDDRGDSTKRQGLALREKSVRGTISNRLKGKASDDAKLNAEVEKPNLQTVDSCAIGPDQNTLVVEFTLKVLGGVQRPSACNCATFAKSYEVAAKDYIEHIGFAELGARYAQNIANGRFLWRNRIGSEKIEVHVDLLNDGDDSTKWKFNAFEYSVRNFDNKHKDLDPLAMKIQEALEGKGDFLLLRVTAFAKVGMAQEVYPSEELILDKGKGNKSRILYDVDGIAAMHSQKVGNALRTIDTWYPDFADESVGPIAIEPYGAVTNLGRAFRTPKAKMDFYSLFDRFATGENLESVEHKHYVMATLVRGGVFGESSK